MGDAVPLTLSRTSSRTAPRGPRIQLADRPPTRAGGRNPDGSGAHVRLVRWDWAGDLVPGAAVHGGNHDLPQGSLGARPDRLLLSDPLAHRRDPACQAQLITPGLIFRC